MQEGSWFVATATRASPRKAGQACAVTRGTRVCSERKGRRVLTEGSGHLRIHIRNSRLPPELWPGTHPHRKSIFRHRPAVFLRTHPWSCDPSVQAGQGAAEKPKLTHLRQHPSTPAPRLGQNLQGKTAGCFFFKGSILSILSTHTNFAFDSKTF